MQKLNLDVLQLNALSHDEMNEIDGGVKFPSWKTIETWANRIVNAIGLADAGERFMKGWNSVDCGCNKK